MKIQVILLLGLIGCAGMSILFQKSAQSRRSSANLETVAIKPSADVSASQESRQFKPAKREVSADLEKRAARVMGSGLFTKWTGSGPDLVLYCTDLFTALDLDTKEDALSAARIHCHVNEHAIVLLLDSRTGKEIGHQGRFGLRLN